MPTIRISEETKAALHELGKTFDSADDVVQRLVREAGHEDLLENGDTEQNDEERPNRSLSAAEAKRRFRDRLAAHESIDSVTEADVTGNRDALRVVTDEGPIHVWLKYSKFAGREQSDHAPFYGATWEMTEKLAADCPLYIAFLGPSENRYWAVPLEDFRTEFDISDDSKGGTQWRFNFDQGSNRELLDAYSSLAVLFE